MDINRIPALKTLVNSLLHNTSSQPDDRAYAENFALEERAPDAPIGLYNGNMPSAPLPDTDAWRDCHRGFCDVHLYLDLEESRQPWTFGPENKDNRLSKTDPNLWLVRVEDADWACGLIRTNIDTLKTHIENLHGQDADRKGEAARFLAELAARWNAVRDKHPLFATFWPEVDHILQDPDPGWAERLRDYLGLGHYSPQPGGPPVPIVVMRYTLQEILDAVSRMATRQCPPCSTAT